MHGRMSIPAMRTQQDELNQVELDGLAHLPELSWRRDRLVRMHRVSDGWGFSAVGFLMFFTRKHWSDRGVAAVYRQGCAGNVTRLWRREENDCLCDLGRVRGSAQ